MGHHFPLFYKMQQTHINNKYTNCHIQLPSCLIAVQENLFTDLDEKFEHRK